MYLKPIARKECKTIMKINKQNYTGLIGGICMSEFIDGFIEKAKEGNNRIENELYSKYESKNFWFKIVWWKLITIRQFFFKIF